MLWWGARALRFLKHDELSLCDAVSLEAFVVDGRRVVHTVYLGMACIIIIISFSRSKRLTEKVYAYALDWKKTCLHAKFQV